MGDRGGRWPVATAWCVRRRTSGCIGLSQGRRGSVDGSQGDHPCREIRNCRSVFAGRGGRVHGDSARAIGGHTAWNVCRLHPTRARRNRSSCRMRSRVSLLELSTTKAVTSPGCPAARRRPPGDQPALADLVMVGMGACPQVRLDGLDLVSAARIGQLRLCRLMARRSAPFAGL